jgi:hypothetical protein
LVVVRFARFAEQSAVGLGFVGAGDVAGARRSVQRERVALQGPQGRVAVAAAAGSGGSRGSGGA